MSVRRADSGLRYAKKGAARRPPRHSIGSLRSDLHPGNPETSMQPTRPVPYSVVGHFRVCVHASKKYTKRLVKGSRKVNDIKSSIRIFYYYIQRLIDFVNIQHIEHFSILGQESVKACNSRRIPL